jgi:hypothetical protein
MVQSHNVAQPYAATQLPSVSCTRLAKSWATLRALVEISTPAKTLRQVALFGATLCITMVHLTLCTLCTKTVSWARVTIDHCLDACHPVAPLRSIGHNLMAI